MDFENLFDVRSSIAAVLLRGCMYCICQEGIILTQPVSSTGISLRYSWILFYVTAPALVCFCKPYFKTLEMEYVQDDTLILLTDA